MFTQKIKLTIENGMVGLKKNFLVYNLVACDK